MIRLSIVIPCRNTARHVEQLEALAQQVWDEPWEVIVADNGSTDGTREILERYRTRLPHLKVVDASARSGAAYARNTGAAAASGELLAFCDADDEVAPGWIAAMAEALGQHGLVASRFDTERLNSDPLQRYVGNPQKNGVQRLWYPPYLPHAGASGLGVRRAVHERVGGFDESLISVEDTDYCLRIQLAGTPLSFAPAALVYVRRRSRHRRIFRQALVLAVYNVLLARRYRSSAPPPPRPWRTYLDQCRRAVRRSIEARDPRSRATAVYEAGWLLGLLVGSVRFRTPPPVPGAVIPQADVPRVEQGPGDPQRRSAGAGSGEAMKHAVALILFNRPDLTGRVFEAIAARPPRLFLIADGPRPDRPEDAARCAAARAAVERVDWDCEVHRDYAAANLGCGRRPASGIGWVFRHVEAAIILEDDCLPHPDFFRFCDELLERYRDDERVMHVSGHNAFAPASPATSYRFSRLGGYWGWATWARAWRHHDMTVARWPEARSSGLLRLVSDHPRFLAEWTALLDTAHRAAGEADYWDFQWAFAMWTQGALAALSNVNLISNLGFRADGTHTTATEDTYAALPVGRLDFPLRHPACAALDHEADAAALARHYAGLPEAPRAPRLPRLLAGSLVRPLRALAGQGVRSRRR